MKTLYTFKLMGIIILIGQLMDLLTTWLGINFAGATELNTLMLPLVNNIYKLGAIKTSVGIAMPVLSLAFRNMYNDASWHVGWNWAMLASIIMVWTPVISNIIVLFTIWSMRT